MKYLNFAVELFLIFSLDYFLGFVINPNTTVSLKNDLGERIVSDGAARIMLGTFSASSFLFVCYCAFADEMEDW